MLKKIVSGGQTGADRAALDAAIESNFPHGGYCPKDRKAEDGRLDSIYLLEEIEGGYNQRTRMNAETTDGTIIFYKDLLEGGTEQTMLLCIKLKKPYKLIDIDLVDVALAAEKILSFASENQIETLNIAGPRSSKCPTMYPYVKCSLNQVLRDAT